MAPCLDGVQGYPQQQAPIISPYDMTQEQRLAEMNAMGAAGHADHRWTYELRPGCVLRVDLDGPQGPRPSLDIALLGSVGARGLTHRAVDAEAGLPAGSTSFYCRSRLCQHLLKIAKPRRSVC